MNFSDSCFRFTFIYGSGNHKPHIFSFIHSSLFKLPTSSFYGFEELLFRTFRKITRKKQRDRAYHLLRCRSLTETWTRNFLEFPEQRISRATVTTAFKLFHVFLVKLLIVHFPCLKPFGAYSHFVKNVYLFQNIALNISLWLKTNLCGTIFPDFREFWSI